jgi:hypothetical protein
VVFEPVLGQFFTINKELDLLVLLIKINKEGVSHSVALPFRLKSTLRSRKKNYGNSNIPPCKAIIFKKKIL